MTSKAPLTNVLNDVSNLHPDTITAIIIVTVLWILCRHIHQSNKQQTCKYNTELGNSTYHELVEQKNQLKQMYADIDQANKHLLEATHKYKNIYKSLDDLTDIYYDN